MNLGVAIVGVAAAAAIGAAIEVRRRHERALHAELLANGTRHRGRVLSVEATGRYAAYRRVTVEVAGRQHVETLAAIEAVELGVEEGSAITVIGRDDPRASGTWQGRILRERSFDRDRPVGVFVAVFIAVLAVAAAMLT